MVDFGIICYLHKGLGILGHGELIFIFYFNFLVASSWGIPYWRRKSFKPTFWSFPFGHALVLNGGLLFFFSPPFLMKAMGTMNECLGFPCILGQGFVHIFLIDMIPRKQMPWDQLIQWILLYKIILIIFNFLNIFLW